MAGLSISPLITSERQKHSVKMDWTKHEYCLLHKHNKLLFFTRALTIREVLRITEKKNYMIAAKDILRLTSMIVFSERGKFRNNLIFFDLRVVKVMCSVSKKKEYLLLCTLTVPLFLPHLPVYWYWQGIWRQLFVCFVKIRLHCGGCGARAGELRLRNKAAGSNQGR